MPGSLLDTSASVLCTHGGQASATMPSPRVQVGGNPITTTSAPHSVSGCPFNAGGSPMPCVVAQWTVGAVRVKSMGAPVLLQDSQATCAPNGTPVTVSVTQARVKGV
ncbi:hypothetical protein AB0Q95_05275 [Streptomyces sp. NPDC059900]|uniref:hypothetical protein n=1 Tax=Streptomyces sp. NPDC059900 TaxID=3155816 RepID=UPI00343D6F4D